MQVKIEYPVFARGKPKGFKQERKVYGAIFSYFDIPEVEDVMASYITVRQLDTKGNVQKSQEFFSNGDGYCYRKYPLYRESEGSIPSIPARHGDSLSPVSSEALVRHSAYLRDRREDELKNLYFPTTLYRDVVGGYGLINVDWKLIRDLEIDPYDSELKRVEMAVKDMIIVGGELYKKVPEPVYAVVVNKNKEIKAALWTVPGFPELDDKIRDETDRSRYGDRSVVGFFSLNDVERMEHFMSDIAAKSGGSVVSNLTGCIETDITDEFLMGTRYNLKLLALRMRRSAIQSITTGATYSDDAYAERILNWNDETLALFRALEEAQRPETWHQDLERLEKAVAACLSYDQRAGTALFSNAHKHEKYAFSDHIWQEWLMAGEIGHSLRI